MRHPQSNDRAVSTQLSHVFGIAMTAILITVVLTGATTHVQNERTSVVQTQLDTVGDRLASEIERVDELGRQGGDVSVRTSVQPTLSGQEYDVQLATGSACDTSNFHTDTCLVLETVDMGLSNKVPLNISNGVTMEGHGGGVYTLGVAGSASQERTSARVNRPLRIGVGESFQVNRFGSVLDASNRPPIARFHFTPGVPRTGDPIRFSATRSFDQDGDITDYRWDFDNDGTIDAVGENVSRELGPGPHTVRLEIRDNEGATSNVTEYLRVSGLAYAGDLSSTSEGAPDFDEGALNFTVQNFYAEEIEVKQVLINPTDDSLTTLENNCNTATECPFGHGDNIEEVMFDRNGTGPRAESMTAVDESIPPGGLIVDLDQPLRLDKNESAEVWVGAFQGVSDLDDKEFELGVRYEVDGHTNSTVFTDVVGSPNIDNFWIKTGSGASGDAVEAMIVSDRKLQHVEIETGGDLGGTESVTGLSAYRQPAPPGQFVYEINLDPSLPSGVVKANLTVAESTSGVSAFETRGPKSINRTIVILDGDYVWDDGGDWDAGTVTDGLVVHDTVGDRSEDVVRIGYPREDQGGSGLRGYWHLDGTPFDGSFYGNDGSDVGNPGTGLGIHGTRSYVFDGSDDYVDVATLDDVHDETSSLSFWIKTTQPGDWNFWEAPGIAGIEEGGGADDIFWGWIDISGRIGIQAGNGDSAMSDDPIDDGAWHHVVLTYRSSDGQAKIYVDGEHQETETTASGPVGNSFSSLGRIEDTAGSPEYFEGQLDEVRSYNRVLTDADVERLYDASGSYETGWKSGSEPLGPSNATLQYHAEVPSSTSMNVTVLADTDGDGVVDRRSDTIDLQDGQRSVAVTGLGNATATNFKLEIEVNSGSALKTPVLRQIGIRRQT